MPNLKSTKFILSIIVASFFFLAFIFSIFTKKDFSPDLFISGLVGVLSLYIGGNVYQKKILRGDEKEITNPD